MGRVSHPLCSQKKIPTVKMATETAITMVIVSFTYLPSWSASLSPCWYFDPDALTELDNRICGISLTAQRIAQDDPRTVTFWTVGFCNGYKLSTVIDNAVSRHQNISLVHHSDLCKVIL
jgi:hypothetical protein